MKKNKSICTTKLELFHNRRAFLKKILNHLLFSSNFIKNSILGVKKTQKKSSHIRKSQKKSAKRQAQSKQFAQLSKSIFRKKTSIWTTSSSEATTLKVLFWWR